MKHHTIIDLPTDYALVLQQVQEDGEDDFASLAETLSVSRPRLAHILDALRQKGLIKMSRAAYDSVVIRLSAKGSKLMTQIWPEAQMRSSLA